MNIIIVGAGLTGTELAKKLVAEKNNVTLIDNDEEIVRHASNRLDCMVVQADGNSLETLEDAGIAKAEALVMLTNSDEVNMITCSLVDAVYPDIIKIARVRNYEYYIKTKKTIKQHADTFSGTHRPLYGIDHMVYPDMEAAKVIIEAVEHGTVTDVLTFDNSEYEIMRVTVEKGSMFDGRRVQDLRSLSENPFLLVYIEQEDKTVVPSGTTIIQAEHCLGILAKRSHMKQFLKLCGSRITELNKIALVGAGHIGTLVAERLVKKPRKSKIPRLLQTLHQTKQEFVIIDKDDQRSRAASERFPSASVFRADITDEGFIEEENLTTFDLIISATHNHELNMVVSAYMKSLGVSKTISLVSSSGFAEIARNIGVDVAVPIKDTVVDTIIGHLRGKSVTGVHTVSDGELEIIEYTVPEISRLLDKSLKDIADPGLFLILLIKADNQSEYFIPDGNTVIKQGNNLVLITHIDQISAVLEYFGDTRE